MQSDKALAKRFTDATLHLSQEEAAALVGMNQRTLSNWRAKKLPAKLPSARRRKIQKVLENGVPESGEDARVRERSARYGAEESGTDGGVTWLPRMLELVLTASLPAAERMELVRQINTAARMQNALWESAAAYRRAGAMQSEGVAAGVRAVSMDEESRTARTGVSSDWSDEDAAIREALLREAEDHQHRTRSGGASQTETPASGDQPRAVG